MQFQIVDVDVPEVRVPAEAPADYVSRVAHEKAVAGLQQLSGTADAIVLGADTEVVLGEDVFGKPADAILAAEMLRRLGGRSHRVITVVWCVSRGRQECAISESVVEFAALSDASISRYIATGEPMGRAGAYAIQGRAAAFISRLSGSYTGVMGLPVYETAQLLQRFGIVV